MRPAQYDATAQWLLDEWITEGPPILVLEGVGGVGKSRLADDLVEKWPGPAVKTVALADSLGVDDVLLDVADKLEKAGHPEVASRADFDFRQGLLEMLKRDTLLVLDNFEEVLDPESRVPGGDYRALLTDVSDCARKGRVLLVTDRALAGGPWLNKLRLRTRHLDAPPEALAVGVLGEMLSDLGLDAKLPDDQRSDVSRWLGGNPRAMQAFTECLRFDPLEELLELEPDAWDLRNEVASPALVGRLEEAFLSRTLDRMSAPSALMAEFLSVYRKPFPRAAFSSLSGIVPVPDSAKEDLASRFMLSYSHRSYSLHPVLRHLAYRKLVGNPRRLQLAHVNAAQQYGRHFRAMNQQPSLGALGEAFVESRHHLLNANRELEFENIASLFRRQLLSHYRSVPKLSDHGASEMLAMLAAALTESDEGYSYLRHALARLLMRRGRPGDSVLALRQLNVAARESNLADLWLLRLKLTWDHEGPVAAKVVARQAFDTCKGGNLWRLYHFQASKLHEVGSLRDALDVVNEAVLRVPQENVFGLYSLGGFMLSRANRSSEAIDVLISGIQLLGKAGSYSYRLLEQATFIAYRNRDVHSLSRIQSEAVEQDEARWNVLVNVARLELAGHHKSAAELAEKNGDYHTLAARAAFDWLACREVGRAAEVINSYAMPDNSATRWIRAMVLLCQGSPESSAEEFSKCLGRGLTDGEINDELLWLKIWMDIPVAQAVHPAFYFPILPAGLTGLESDISVLSLGMVEEMHLTKIDLPRPPIVAEGSSREEQVALPFREITTVVTREGNVVPGDVNVNFGSLGAQGSNSTASNFRMEHGARSADASDIASLVSELESLRRAMKGEAQTPDHDIAVAEIALAEKAAGTGDHAAFLGHLRKAGGWALGVATTIGTALAAAALKSALEGS